MNAPLVSCPFPVITFKWVQQQTHPKVMTGNGQLTRGALIVNDFLRNSHFKGQLISICLFWGFNSPKKRTWKFKFKWGRNFSFVFLEELKKNKMSFRNLLTFGPRQNGNFITHNRIHVILYVFSWWSMILSVLAGLIWIFTRTFVPLYMLQYFLYLVGECAEWTLMGWFIYSI